MNSSERNQKALGTTFEQTLKGRKLFQELDLRSTKAVVDLLTQAVNLAKEHPREFFVGFSRMPRLNDTTNAVGGAQQAAGRVLPPIEQIENLLDYLKAQKEYWGGRDDTGQESIGIRVISRGSARRPGSDRYDVIVELDPPPESTDSIEVFDPRTGAKLGNMRELFPGVYAGPENGLDEGQPSQIRVNGVPVANVTAGRP